MITKKVELLRVVERTAEQVDELITNLSELGEFSQTDKELMESFKRIPHVGVDQLEQFINLLESKGAELDEYSIIYYTAQLKLGPLQQYTDQFTNFIAGSSRMYWKRSPDILGGNSNVYQDDASTAIHSATDTPSFTPPLVNKKLPLFIQQEISTLCSAVQGIQSACFRESVKADNTLPIVDKLATQRVQEELAAGRNSKPHGNYIVKDVEYQAATNTASDPIQANVSSFLGAEDYRMYRFKRDYNPFDPDKNNIEAVNHKVLRKLVNQLTQYTPDGVEIKTFPESIIETDLIGNQFDSVDRRNYTLPPIAGVTDNQFDVYTIAGQLGSGEIPKVEPIN